MFNLKGQIEKLVKEKIHEKYPFTSTHLYVNDIVDFALFCKWIKRFNMNPGYRYTLTEKRVEIYFKIKFFEHRLVVSTDETVEESLKLNDCKVLVDRDFPLSTSISHKKIVFI